MTKTIVGLFDDMSSAERARNNLKALGIDDSYIEQASASDYQATTTKPQEKSGFFERLLGFGVPNEDAGLYTEGIRRGGYALTVRTDESLVEDVVDTIERDGAINIDRHAEYLREKGWTGYDPTAPQYDDPERIQLQKDYKSWEGSRFPGDNEERVIPVIEEDVKIGKRTVEGRGGVRVYSMVTETPVEEDVTLHKEHVRVDRRPVDRPVGAEMNAFEEGEFEVTERSEEAVISKEPRVVEEVVVSKETKDETQHIRETKKRKDVRVESLKDKEPR